MPLWIGETWLCKFCDFVNAVLRKRCHNCGKGQDEKEVKKYELDADI